MLGLPRRQATRVQEEPIPEDLIANIPVFGEDRVAAGATFAVEREEVIGLGPTAEDAPPLEMSMMEDATLDEMPPTNESAPGPSAAGALAAQLRYDLGEALARELDRAMENIVAGVGDLEARIQQAEAALVAAHEELEREREARATAEKRLQAIKDLALR